MNLIIFGPPGSGKGTYSSRLQQPLNIVKVSTGDMFREIAKQNTPFGKKIFEIINKGEFVPDKIAIDILKERISQPDAKKGFILDGFPRTINQAKFLKKLIKIDVIINIITPEEILLEKLSARRICKKCGDIYNIADIKKTVNGIDYILPPMLPKKENVCDKCGGELYQRDDDKPNTIKTRLKVYEKQAKPVITFFKGKIPFADIYMNRPPEIVVERILDELKKLNLMK